MNCIITYQKRNGDIFIRPYDFTLRRIGDATSMGWKIIDIHYYYEGNYYCMQDYTRICKGKEIKPNFKKRAIKNIIKALKKYA